MNWKGISEIASFIGVQYVLGRRGSFPYGLILDFSLLKIGVVVILSDVIQTIILINFLPAAIRKVKELERVKTYLEKKRENSEGRFRNYFRKYGSSALLLISALPYGGGSLTGSVLAVSLKISKIRSFLLIITGCVIGTFIFYLIFTGLISIIRFF